MRDRPVPVGRPNDNVMLYILNDDNQLLPKGLAGELCISGDGVGRGYLNHDELNLEKFIPNPYASHAGARLYRTGDLARRLSDGAIDFIGRNDRQVKLRGFRIELEEIEEALKHHAGVTGVHGDPAATPVNGARNGPPASATILRLGRMGRTVLGFPRKK